MRVLVRTLGDIREREGEGSSRVILEALESTELVCAMGVTTY